MASSTPGAVPFVDLDRIHAPLWAQLRGKVEEVARRGDFILGEELERFEADFASYLGVEHVVGVGSGTAALTIAARAAGIGPGDEVIVPAHTYIASALGVSHAGATPVFCDVEDRTGLVDLDAAAAALSERTAAILVVHLYGQPCDMDAARSFAGRHGIALFEDAAQAHGARWGEDMAGSLGAASAFSFYPSKNLGAFGDGGAVCSDDGEIARRARELRNLGQRGKGHHVAAGYNERLDTLQAAVLRAKLPLLEGWNHSRRLAAAIYRERLPEGLSLPPERPQAHQVHHLMAVRAPDRDALVARLREAGVGVQVHYSPTVPRQPPFAAGSGAAEAPVAEHWAEQELSLPMFAGLREDEVAAVCERLEDAIE